ncbi:hypothetical protein PENTCL1PPCAC_29298, partial [Pristionchus entomophagus]
TSEIGSIDSLRGNFEAMKKELSCTMNLCKKTFDQPNRLMYTVTELLYNAIDTVQHNKKFKSTTLMFAAFDMIEICDPPVDTHEVILLKFAKSFALFMDSLNGLNLQKKQREPKVDKFERNNANTAKTVKLDRYEPLRPPKRARPNADIDALDSSHISRPTNYKTESPDAFPSFSFLTRPICEELIVVKPSSSSRLDGHPMNDDAIKQEEPDYDEDFDIQPRLFNASIEVKQEDEEPLEPPMLDKIVIDAKPTTSDEALKRGRGRPRKHFPNEMTLRPKNYCSFCDIPIALSNLKEHVRNDHKDEWLNFAPKCPEAECDFRSNVKAEIDAHREAIHTDIYHSWKKTQRFYLQMHTPCPFCTHRMKNVAAWINHMEVYHSRLASYDFQILQCSSCAFTTSRCHEMFEHWLENNAKCHKGMRFDYPNARKLLTLEIEKLQNHSE